MRYIAQCLRATLVVVRRIATYCVAAVAKARRQVCRASLILTRMYDLINPVAPEHFLFISERRT